MAAEGVYMVEPAKPWHETRLTAEEWFEQNPPHQWRSLKDAIEHYTASGFEVSAANEAAVIFEAQTRYTTPRARVEARAALEQAEELRRALEELGEGLGQR